MHCKLLPRDESVSQCGSANCLYSFHEKVGGARVFPAARKQNCKNFYLEPDGVPMKRPANDIVKTGSVTDVLQFYQSGPT